MFTFTIYQLQPILVSNYCKNLSRFSVSLLFLTTYHFWHIRLNFSPGPICQRNRKCLLLWHICQWLRFETRWVLILTQKQFLPIEEAESLDQLSLNLCFIWTKSFAKYVEQYAEFLKLKEIKTTISAPEGKLYLNIAMLSWYWNCMWMILIWLSAPWIDCMWLETEL